MISLNPDECKLLNYLIDELKVANVEFKFVPFIPVPSSPTGLHWRSSDDEVNLVKNIVDLAVLRGYEVNICTLSVGEFDLRFAAFISFV